MAVDGSTTQEVFEAYLEHVLLPEVDEGQVMVMDKLPAHKPNRVRELIEQRGCELVVLAQLLPGLQPHRRGLLQDQGDPTQGLCQDSRGPVEAMGQALSAISSRDVRGFFEHAGYHPTGQLL